MVVDQVVVDPPLLRSLRCPPGAELAGERRVAEVIVRRAAASQRQAGEVRVDPRPASVQVGPCTR
jgi:hypothetical protein